MKFIQTYFTFLFAVQICFSQSILDATVMLEARVDSNAKVITLVWPKADNALSYRLYRKPKNSTSWGATLANLAGSDSTYIDNNVDKRVVYEYRIDKSGNNFSGQGFITSGINVDEIEYRGIMILLIDGSIASDIASSITVIKRDLEGDGWVVKLLIVARNESTVNVRNAIQSLYNEDKVNTKGLTIIGHVPVPYSGNINPDGHPDHQGAWPTDLYYADMDGIWTDQSVSSNTANPGRTINLPGDGKFDQSSTPSTIELQVGRIDFYDLPAFAMDEVQLLKNYFEKNHEYRNKKFSVQKRAIVDDNFGYFSGEAFAASGYNNFGPLVGNANISASDYFTNMDQNVEGYLWSYGCGGGSFTSAGGIGNTTNFANANLNGIFTMLFGSYFGDWDVRNSFLRAPLAQGRMLTSCWSGRPHLQFHQMALGDNIGSCFLFTVNNQSLLYFQNIYGINGRWVHNALMGDPSLRNDVVQPTNTLEAYYDNNIVNLHWNKSDENNLIGYQIYAKKIEDLQFSKLANISKNDTSLLINCLQDTGTYVYMVRVKKWEESPSGTYYNLSEGTMDTLSVSSVNKVKANFTLSTSQNIVSLSNTSSGATAYLWIISNGITSSESDLEVGFDSSGTYTITLIATNECGADTLSQIVDIHISSIFTNNDAQLNIYPIPARDQIEIEYANCQKCKLEVIDYLGRKLESCIFESKQSLDIKNLSRGSYHLFLKTINGVEIASKTFIKY